MRKMPTPPEPKPLEWHGRTNVLVEAADRIADRIADRYIEKIARAREDQDRASFPVTLRAATLAGFVFGTVLSLVAEILLRLLSWFS